jgi:hypothetical protein
MMAGTKSQKEKKLLPTAPEGNQDSNKSNVSANGKDDSKLPASSVAAKKDSAGIKVVTPMSSPKRKSKADIVTESQEKAKKKERGWYLRSAMLHGRLEIIFITTETMVDDAYMHPLISLVEGDVKPEKDIEHAILKLGILGKYYMRVSLENPGKLCNQRQGKTTYQRRAFVRMLDENETDNESRLKCLELIKTYLKDRKNNNYGMQVFIEEKEWNMTENGELLKLDNFLLYREILKVIRKVYLNVDENWAKENIEDAMSMFTEGYVPHQAMDDIGMPLEKVLLEEDTLID